LGAYDAYVWTATYPRDAAGSLDGLVVRAVAELLFVLRSAET
jgi:hypothetical protein